MTAKLDPFAAAPALFKTWMSASLAIIEASTRPSRARGDPRFADQWLRELSQHAHCLGPPERRERAAHLPALRLARGALLHRAGARGVGWTDALTRLSEGHHHKTAYEALQAQFSEEEQVKLTLVINSINGWNRLAVGFGLWVEPAAVKSAAKAAAVMANARRTQRRVSTRCVSGSCASPTACSAPWLRPRIDPDGNRLLIIPSPHRSK